MDLDQYIEVRWNGSPGENDDQDSVADQLHVEVRNICGWQELDAVHGRKGDQKIGAWRVSARLAEAFFLSQTWNQNKNRAVDTDDPSPEQCPPNLLGKLGRALVSVVRCGWGVFV